MWGILGATIGFIGGLVVAHVSALLQRKNWQLQEAMKAYAQLLAEGEREMRLSESLWIETLMGDAAVEGLQEKLGTLTDSLFIPTIKQCWLLESDETILAQIKQLDAEYDDWRDRCKQRIEQVMARRRGEPLEHIDNNSAEVLRLMQAIRDQVAKRYFGHREQPASRDLSGPSL